MVKNRPPGAAGHSLDGERAPRVGPVRSGDGGGAARDVPRAVVQARVDPVPETL